MRTNIEIDERLLRKAMRLNGAKTKRVLIEDALREFVRVRELQTAFKKIEGIGWEGNLDEMRRGRTF